MTLNSNTKKTLAAICWTLGIALVCALFIGAYKFGEWEKRHAPPPPQPVIVKTRPADLETGVLPNAFVSADVFLPNFGHGIDARTMNTHTVKMFRVDGEKKIEVPGHVNTSGAGDAIVFQPTDILEADAKYSFECNGVRDTSDGEQSLFKSFSSTFTTASSSALSQYPVAFEKMTLPNTAGNIFTGVT